MYQRPRHTVAYDNIFHLLRYGVASLCVEWAPVCRMSRDARVTLVCFPQANIVNSTLDPPMPKAASLYIGLSDI
jgi:hypothetical protein